MKLNVEKTSMLYWFPTVEKLGIPVPRTIMIKTKKNLTEVCQRKGSDSLSMNCNWAIGMYGYCPHSQPEKAWTPEKSYGNCRRQKDGRQPEMPEWFKNKNKSLHYPSCKRLKGESKEKMCPCRGDPCPEEVCGGTVKEFREGRCHQAIRKDMKGDKDWERWLEYVRSM